MCKPTKNTIYRSKGCLTCRARKLGCDQTHPFCTTCANANRHCAGYSTPTIFLLSTPQSIAKSLSRPGPQSQPASLSLSLSPASPRALSIPPSAKHITFLAHTFLLGSPGERKGFSWLRRSLRATQNENYLLWTSAQCLAEVFYGRHFKLYGAITSAMARYGQLLGVLREEVARLMAAQVGDLAQVIVTCIITESVLAPTVGGLQFGGMHAHVDGLAQIFRVLGSEVVRTRLDILLFGTCRCYIIGRAVNTKRPTFMASPEWKSDRWEFGEKRKYMRLWDLLCDVPTFLAEIERLRIAVIDWPVVEVKGSVINPRHQLSMKLKSLLQELFRWRWDWERDCDSGVEEVPTNPLNTVVIDNYGNPQFSTCLCYSDEVTKEIIYYQAILTFLLRMGKLLFNDRVLDGVEKAETPGLARPLRPSLLLLPSEVHSLEDASTEFYRSMEGHLSAGAEKPAVEFYQLMFPLSLVTLGVEPDSMEEKWTKNIRRRMIGASGFDMWVARMERDEEQIASLLKPGACKY